VPAERIVFFDDVMENIEGARAADWQAVRHPTATSPMRCGARNLGVWWWQ